MSDVCRPLNEGEADQVGVVGDEVERLEVGRAERRQTEGVCRGS